MDSITLMSNQIKTLIALCDERGLPVAFTVDDIDEILSEDSDVKSKLRTLNRVHSAVHEVLYAPPGGR